MGGGKNWSAEDEQYLRMMNGKLPEIDQAIHLGRSKPAVHAKRIDLRLGAGRKSGPQHLAPVSPKAEPNPDPNDCIHHRICGDATITERMPDFFERHEAAADEYEWQVCQLCGLAEQVHAWPGTGKLTFSHGHPVAAPNGTGPIDIAKPTTRMPVKATSEELEIEALRHENAKLRESLRAMRQDLDGAMDELKSLDLIRRERDAALAELRTIVLERQIADCERLLERLRGELAQARETMQAA